MKKALSLLLALTLLLLCSCGSDEVQSEELTQYHAEEIPIDADIVTIDAICFYDDTSYMLCRSADASRLLLSMNVGENPEYIEFDGAEMKDIEMSASGTLYSCATDEDGDVVVMKSTRNGAGDKSVELVIDDVSPGMSISFQDLALDGGGKVYVAWACFSEESFATATAGVTVLDSELNHVFTLEHE